MMSKEMVERRKAKRAAQQARSKKASADRAAAKPDAPTAKAAKASKAVSSSSASHGGAGKKRGWSFFKGSQKNLDLGHSPENPHSLENPHSPENKQQKPPTGAAGRIPFKERNSLYKLGYSFSVAGVWAVIMGLVALGVLASELPDLERLPAPGASRPAVLIKASNGADLLRVGPVAGDQLDYDEIPDVLIQAFMAIEDRAFFSHFGINPKGLARAALANLQAGQIRAGGSTITQQLAKNLFLTFDQTATRKARELLLAFWLEQRFSKQEIFSLYLNRIYFGGGAYGIDAASQKFFGHSARTLSLREAAVLAGIVKAPSRLAPHINPGGAWERAIVVLKAMQDIELLSEAARLKLSETPPRFAPRDANIHMRYFADWVLAEARASLGGGSFTIYTTLDPVLQRTAADTVARHVAGEGVERNASQAALIALDPDGAVRAMVGGADYADSQFNRVTQAKRQPGSAFKLFTYLAALEDGVKANDRYVDEPTKVDDWSPKNYSGKFYGKMTVREAFARSINTVAVQLNESLGRDRAVEMADRLGVGGTIAPVASLPLGTEEVRLIDLTRAYASVANGGFKVTPYGIIEIRDPSGALLYRKPRPQPIAVLNHRVVERMAGLLTSVIEDGSGRNAALDRPAGGKSGTSQDNRDAVFVGFTSDLVTAVWTGNDDGTEMRAVTGGGMPARIWRDFMLESHAGKPVRALLADSGLYAEAAGTLAKQASKKPPKPKKKSFFDRIF